MSALEETGQDPFLRWGVPVSVSAAAMITDEVTMVVHGADPRLWVVPAPEVTPERVRVVLADFVAGGGVARTGISGICVPQPYAEVAHAVFDLAEGGDWDWMWTTEEPPAHPLEHRLSPLDDVADAEVINTFSGAHNPRVWSTAGTGRTERWLAAYADDDGPTWRLGDLIAVGGLQREPSRAAHLAGIVTHQGIRRAGWGTAISAALTRLAVRTEGVCTLGMYADNDAARRVYHRLGYRTAHVWHSRRLAGRDQSWD